MRMKSSSEHHDHPSVQFMAWYKEWHQVLGAHQTSLITSPLNQPPRSRWTSGQTEDATETDARLNGHSEDWSNFWRTKERRRVQLRGMELNTSAGLRVQNGYECRYEQSAHYEFLFLPEKHEQCWMCETEFLLTARLERVYVVQPTSLSTWERK